MDQLVPKILHRIWLGDKPIPKSSQAYWKGFKRLNPGWTFKTWTESDLQWLKNQELFDTLPTLSERSDVARFEILAKQGGIYIDTDVEPLKAWDRKTRTGDFIVGWEYGKVLGTAVLCSARGGRGARRLVDNLPEQVSMHMDSKPAEKTGPRYVTGMMWKQPYVKILPRVYFYPYGWFEKEKRHLFEKKGYPKQSYVAHHWAGSWL